MASRRKKRRKRKHKAAQSLATTAQSKDGNPAVDTGGVESEIRKLISRGKYRGAVSKAKAYHKSFGTQASQTLLLDAYSGRITEMIDNGYIVEAEALLDLIIKRFDPADHRFEDLNGILLIQNGRIEEFLQPLADPGIPEDRKSRMEHIITREIVDVRAIAECDALPSDHQLRKGASSVADALEAVTSGPVEDESIALPGISRRSPFAPWKMLIRAFASFYRKDDVACMKNLESIGLDSAPGRLVPILRSMMSGNSNRKPSPATDHLLKTVTGNRSALRQALQQVESYLAKGRRNKFLAAVRRAVDVCGATSPETLDRLRQHISIKAWMNGYDAGDIVGAMEEPSVRNAYFWRLHARAAEVKERPIEACGLWEKFRKHAIDEGWFPPEGKEASALYLHMADQLNRMPAEDLEWERSEYEILQNGSGDNPNDRIRHPSDAVAGNRGENETYDFLYPERLFKSASDIDPSPETFQHWLTYLVETEAQWQDCDAVSLAWHGALPKDPRPLLNLMDSAEKRNALKKALGYLETAERLDGLNPEVRNARVRLLAATAVRHLKQRKTHLVEKDISEMESLPQIENCDRRAFPMALRILCAMIDNNDTRRQNALNDLTAFLGNADTASVLLAGLSTICRLHQYDTLHAAASVESNGVQLAEAIGRGCRIGDDIGIPLEIPSRFEGELSQFFTTQGSAVETPWLKSIARAALRAENPELAYAASGAGLLKEDDDLSRFLLLRAQSLPMWSDRRDDCFGAVIEMARRRRDMDLLDEAVESHRKRGRASRFSPLFYGDIPGVGDRGLDGNELDAIVKREKESAEYPDIASSHGFYDEDDWEEHNCRHCDAKDCEDRDEPYRYSDVYEDGLDDDFDLFDDPDDPDGSLSDATPEVISLFMEIIGKHGAAYTDAAKMMELEKKDPELFHRLLDVTSGGKGDSSKRARKGKRKKR